MAAEKLQARFRGFKARRAMSKNRLRRLFATTQQHIAASKVQATYRGLSTRKEVLEIAKKQKEKVQEALKRPKKRTRPPIVEWTRGDNKPDLTKGAGGATLSRSKTSRWRSCRRR